MKKYLHLTLLCCCLCGGLLAQEICNNNVDDDNDGQVDFLDCDCTNNRGNSWHFGSGIGIDFNTNPPTPFLSSMETFEGASSICDEDGNLLFYSNGGGRLPGSGQNPGFIWDRNGDVMYDMMGTEGGGFSATNSCVAVKKPNSTTNYYLFTMEENEFDVDGAIPGQEEGRGLSYFEIDMSANGGLGAVVLADQRLLVPTYEIMAAIEHDNGEDYWIIVIRDGAVENREFIVFEVTAAGVNQAGSYSFPFVEGETFAFLKTSPNRRQLCEWSPAAVVFTDFNPATGVLSNRVRVPQQQIIGAEFSPSGQYCYFAQREDFNGFERTIVRLDLSTLSPTSTFEEVLTYTLSEPAFFVLTQVGPNGNIYFRDAIGFLGAILCPDSPTPSVDTEYIQVIENTNSQFFGLPISMPTYPNHYFFQPFDPLEITGATDYELCGDAITIGVQTNKCVDLLWSTGAVGDSITVSEAGIYTVTAINECETEMLEISVTAGNASVFEVDVPNEACVGETVSFVPIDLPADVQVEWRTLGGQLVSTDPTVSVQLTQDTQLVVSFILDCGTTQTVVAIDATEPPLPELSIIDADCINPNGSVELIEPQSSWVVQWVDPLGNTIGNDTAIDGLGPGAYIAVISSIPNNANCTVGVPFIIQEVSTLLIEEVSVIGNSCPDDQAGMLEILDIDGQEPFVIEWLDATATQVLSTEILLENLSNGTYLLRVTDDNGCTAEQSYIIESPPVPSISIASTPAFCDTPNGAILLNNVDSLPLQIELNGQAVDEAELLALLPTTYQLAVRSEENCLVLDSTIFIENVIDTSLSGQLSLSGFANRPLFIDLGLTDLNNIIIEWSPSSSLSCTDCPNPTVELSESTVLQATLTDTSTGCTGVYEVDITIRAEEKVYIPNAFSPNDDGANDFFEVFTSDPEVRVLSIEVYNRWGSLVFEQSGADLRWNGTFNGSALPSGVYVYAVEVQFSTGIELLSGDVALMR
ncbi:MAG: gliding motility-associated C-terminal domain-containing protein [Bacteroidota bacterium]